jgi:hypothetical protein
MGDVIAFTPRRTAPVNSSYSAADRAGVRAWLQLDGQDFVLRANGLELAIAAELARADMAELEPYSPDWLQLWAHADSLDQLLKERMETAFR